MFPCAGCKRHLRASELNCPFCGAEVRFTSICASSARRGVGAVAVCTLALLGTAACSSERTATDGNTTTTNASTTLDDTSESGMSTETDTADGSDDSSASTGSFYAGPDPDFAPATDCDPFLQDCPEGEKCVAYPSTGASWDANKCVPVYGDGQPGDPCVSGGFVVATDDCGEASFCFYVQEVDDQLVGVCTAFCEGTPDAPQCPPSTTCVIGNEGAINLCIHECDPLAQDCPAELACYWFGEEFGCAWPSPNPIGGACDQVADCAAGSLCVESELTPDCGGAGCCAEHCSLTDPSCSQPETECVAFFADPPAGYEDVGLCVSPD